MKLGIPTLCRYDLLLRLLESAAAGSLKPTGYIIVDNGGHLDVAAVSAIIGSASLEVITPHSSSRGLPANAGVSASWNRILDSACNEPVVISNDDIVFREDTFQKLHDAVQKHPFVGACGGWALFAQSPECTRKVGYYDENFWPAYYEDCDYLLRMLAAGVPTVDLGHIATHVGEQSTAGAEKDPKLKETIALGRMHNRSYFVTKWGSDSPRWGNPHVNNYPEPFNGKPPPGFDNRKPAPTTTYAPLRWDILNALAERIGARRYLEIGVADGSCARRINVRERWGVDPNPQYSAVDACTMFFPMTSEEFFRKHLPEQQGRFDLIFIDGLHHAEVVMEEVPACLELLTPHGALCLHDCNPHTELMQRVPLDPASWQWTGDVWKAIARFRSYGVDIRVVNADYGVGILRPGAHTPDDIGFKLPAELTYADLDKDREQLLGLVQPWDWERLLIPRS